MAFISRLINKRIASLISRFEISRFPPHLVDKIIIDNIRGEKEAKTTNLSS